MLTSDSIGAIAAAFAEFNKQVANPVADRLAKVRSERTGSEYTYSYADLGGITDVVRPALAEVGISVLQEVVEHNGAVGARTLLLHSSGEWFRFEAVWVPGGRDAQDAGKAISYSRRYGLLAALGLAPREDSDGPAGRGERGAQTAARRGGASGRSQRSTPAEPIVDALDQTRLAERAAQKGRSAEQIGDLLKAKDYAGPLEKMPVRLYEYVMAKLERLPDAEPTAAPATDSDVVRDNDGEVMF